MSSAALSHALSRYHGTRRLLETERRRPGPCSIRLLRIQALLLRAQERLVARLVALDPPLAALAAGGRTRGVHPMGC